MAPDFRDVVDRGAIIIEGSCSIDYNLEIIVRRYCNLLPPFRRYVCAGRVFGVHRNRTVNGEAREGGKEVNHCVILRHSYFRADTNDALSRRFCKQLTKSIS